MRRYRIKKDRKSRIIRISLCICMAFFVTVTVSLLKNTVDHEINKEADFAFAKNSITIRTGSRADLKMRYSPAGAKKPVLEYLSGNSRIASVNKNGSVSGKSPGTVKIAAVSQSGGVKAVCTVTVRKVVRGKAIFLTYDDGPSSNVTPRLLDVLKKYNVHATFFIVGYEAKKYPRIVKREYNEGHTVGIHTYSHKYKKIYASKKAFFKDFEKDEQLLKKITGKKPAFCRMPGDSDNTFVSRKRARAIIREMKQRGYTCIDWNAASYDAMGRKYSVKKMTRMAIRTIRENRQSVVLMHDAKPKKATPRVTENVIRYFKKRGYTFEGLDGYEGRDILFINK